MLTTRSISESGCMDLLKNDFTLRVWEKILKDCYLFLQKENIIKDMNDEELFGKYKIEDKVSHLIRDTDSIPKKTKCIFMAIGKQKYYLNVFNYNKIELN